MAAAQVLPRHLTNYYSIVSTVSSLVVASEDANAVVLAMHLNDERPYIERHYIGVVFAAYPDNVHDTFSVINRLPFTYTDGRWVRIAGKTGLRMWYMGIIVPAEAVIISIQAALSLLWESDRWEVYIGEGHYGEGFHLDETNRSVLDAETCYLSDYWP